MAKFGLSDLHFTGNLDVICGIFQCRKVYLKYNFLCVNCMLTHDGLYLYYKHIKSSILDTCFCSLYWGWGQYDCG